MKPLPIPVLAVIPAFTLSVAPVLLTALLLTGFMLAAPSLPPLTDNTSAPIGESETMHDRHLSDFGEASSDSPPVSYIVEKPVEKAAAEKKATEDKPLPFGPQFPSHRFSQEDVLPAAGPLPKHIVRGQMNTVDSLDAYLSTPPPVAQGPVEEGMINTHVVSSIPETILNSTPAEETFPPNPLPAEVKQQTQQAVDPLGLNLLLVAVAFTTIGLIYMAFVAYDYRQRWMHSLTAQNERYLGNSTYDMEMEEVYSGGAVTFS